MPIITVYDTPNGLSCNYGPKIEHIKGVTRSVTDNVSEITFDIIKNGSIEEANLEMKKIIDGK